MPLAAGSERLRLPVRRMVGTVDRGRTSYRRPRVSSYVAFATIAGGTWRGDGVLGVGEQCDDGNSVDGDCCSSSCSDRTTLLQLDAARAASSRRQPTGGGNPNIGIIRDGDNRRSEQTTRGASTTPIMTTTRHRRRGLDRIRIPGRADVQPCGLPGGDALRRRRLVYDADTVQVARTERDRSAADDHACLPRHQQRRELRDLHDGLRPHCWRCDSHRRRAGRR
jgi:cysteine-rich repeat protein